MRSKITNNFFSCKMLLLLFDFKNWIILTINHKETITNVDLKKNDDIELCLKCKNKIDKKENEKEIIKNKLSISPKIYLIILNFFIVQIEMIITSNPYCFI